MGCGHSKLPRRDQDAAVALCRDRSALLADAIRHRYALAAAHRAYAASLRAAGAALHDFLLLLPPPPPEPPALPLRLPERRKGDPLPAADAPSKADDDGGHICFHSDDDDGPDGAHIRFPSDDDHEADPHVPCLEPIPPAAPPPPPQQQVAPPFVSGYAPPLYSSYVPGHAYGYGPDIDGYGHSFFNISYARSQPPPPSVSYEHRTQATNATVHYYPGNGASGPPLPGSYYGGYQYRYPNDGGFHETAASSVDGAAPSPPQVSSWDFFNPFESVETYYQEEPAAVAAHTSNVAQEGGEILELENAKVEEEVVKEARNNGNHDSEADKAGLAKDEGRSSVGEEPHRKSKSSEASSMVHDVHVVEKSVVEQHSDAAAVPGKSYNDDIEVAREIRSQFEHAANSASNVSKVLEVGKMPYHHKSSGLKGLSMKHSPEFQSFDAHLMKIGILANSIASVCSILIDDNLWAAFSRRGVPAVCGGQSYRTWQPFFDIAEALHVGEEAS